MGKIYDALKRAEREAKVIRERHFVPERKDITSMNDHAESTPAPREQQEITPALPEQPEVCRIPELKLIPEFIASEKKEVRTLPHLSFKGEDNKGFPEKNLFVIQDTNSFAAEQYRILRTRIQSYAKEAGIKTILITSCLPEEGKSTVSSNLSICIAQSINEYALLIDCDLRRPVIHKLFELRNTIGLSNYLSENIALPHILNKTKIEKLTILPAGASPSNPSELLSSQKMISLIHEVRSRYDDRYIIFDSTPVHQTPDPTILAKLVDGIILVVREGITNREIVVKTVETLGKEKILGVVFNMAREPIKSHYYKYNYYYSTNYDTAL